MVEVISAVCLVLVIEGIFPFLNPQGYKNAMRALLDLDNSKLRIFGLSSMIVGVVLLTLVR